MITLENICKTYRVPKRDGGFGNAVKALFSREYEEIHALNGLSFSVGDGEIVGFIGPNGAGKSTAVKIMCGILRPDSGKCVIDGISPADERREHVSRIGVVFGQRSQMWWDVPVIDSFELIREIYSIPSDTYKRNLYKLTSELQLDEIMRTPARMLSLGQRMRCEIAASLLHDPKVLFLDEPTIGLDASSKLAVRRFVKSLSSEKKTTVILTTHDMQDIEALTERILLIGKGKILLDGSLSELKRKSSPIRRITVSHSSPFPEFVCHEGMEITSVNEFSTSFSADTDIISVSDAVSAISSQAEITDMNVSGNSAEELAASLYSDLHI